MFYSQEVCISCISLALFNSFTRLNINDTFAFGAEQFISHHVATWMMSYSDQVIVSGQPSTDCIGQLLYASSVGKHTPVVFISKITDESGNQFHTTRYIWEHASIQPNSFSYPIACPSCHCLYSWQVVSGLFENGESAELACTRGVKGKKCDGTWLVPAVPSSTVLTSPYVGTWRKV